MSNSRNNRNAIAYNKALGYVLCEGQENIENQKYVLTKENFEKKADKIRKAALQLCGWDNSTTVVIEKHDYENGVGQLMEVVLKPLNIKPVICENGDKVYYLNWIISG